MIAKWNYGCPDAVGHARTSLPGAVRTRSRAPPGPVGEPARVSARDGAQAGLLRRARAGRRVGPRVCASQDRGGTRPPRRGAATMSGPYRSPPEMPALVPSQRWITYEEALVRFRWRPLRAIRLWCRLVGHSVPLLVTMHPVADMLLVPVAFAICSRCGIILGRVSSISDATTPCA